MNYIKQLTHFFNKAQTDDQLSPTHISLFMALFQLWNQSRFAPSIQIARDDVMASAKISSKATYHKAMSYLHQQGYISYQPSYNPYKGSKIAFFPPMDNHSPTKSKPVQQTTTTSINEPSNKLYNTTIINDNSRLRAPYKKNEEQKIVTDLSTNGRVEKETKEKSSAEKEKNIPPASRQVEEFFISQKSTIQEAHRFINHYTANGWLVGGKSPMRDWKASAKNWIANSLNFTKNGNQNKSNRAQQLNVTSRKDYFEPL